jgi:hypothetical protein
MMPVQAQTLLIGTIKTRSLASHAVLKLPPRLFELKTAALRRDQDVMPQRIGASSGNHSKGLGFLAD